MSTDNQSPVTLPDLKNTVDQLPKLPDVKNTVDQPPITLPERKTSRMNQRKQPKSIAAKGFRAKRGDNPRGRLHERVDYGTKTSESDRSHIRNKTKSLNIEDLKKLIKASQDSQLTQV